jgi:hypothetical protein
VRHAELSSDVGRAEKLLQMHGDSTLHMQNCVYEVMQMGQDLLQVNGFLKFGLIFVSSTIDCLSVAYLPPIMGSNTM